MIDNRKLLYTVSLVLGVVIGLVGAQVASGNSTTADEDKKYCERIEENVQGNMSQGFINCLTPDKLESNLSEKVKENTELKCICRRKIGENIQTFQITTSK